MDDVEKKIEKADVVWRAQAGVLEYRRVAPAPVQNR